MFKLNDAIDAVLQVDPDAPELEFEDRWWTWGELAAAASRIEAELDALGCGQNSRTGVVIKNRACFIPVLIALFRSNRCLVTINGKAPSSRLVADMAEVEVPVVLADSETWADQVVADAICASGAAGFRLDDDLGISRSSDPTPGRPIRRYAEGVAIEMLTSGTTGPPKRIPQPRSVLQESLAGAASYEKGRSADQPPKLRTGVQIVTAPLAHIAGITGVMNNMLGGRRISLIDRFTVTTFIGAIKRHRPKVAGAPPAAIRMILDADVAPDDLSSLVAFRTGTAPLDVAIADEFYNKYKIPILQNYGATEFGGAAGWTIDDFRAHWQDKKGAVGRLNKGIEGRIIDPESQEALSGEGIGLLELRGGNIGDGKTWVRTTDLAELDSDRFLYIRGRADNAIIRGGFKIIPDDLVKAIEAHPGVLEVGIVALADKRLGQVPAAAYKLRTDAEAPMADELERWLRERLMPYQIPVLLLPVSEFPRTPSMKISQPELLAIIASARRSDQKSK